MSNTLYSIVDKKYLHDVVETFYHCINLPIYVIDEEGAFLESFGKMENFCLLFSKYLPKGESCSLVHINASKKAVAFGETYIFSCHAHLNHIVFPLINKGEFLGSILLGPFLMDEPDSLLVSDLAKKYNLSVDVTLNLFEKSTSIPIIPPSKVNHFNKLLFFLFQNLIGESKNTFKKNNQILLQQSKIADAIQRYKNTNIYSANYPYEKERELITKVKTGNVEEAINILSDLLGYILLLSDNNLDIVKFRSVELCSIVSRAVVEGGSLMDGVLKINNNFLENISNINSFESLSLNLQQVIEAFTESLREYSNNKNNDIIKKSINYITTNFNKSITLEEVSDFVGLTPTYFSYVFKQTTGNTFTHFLNSTRVEESKRLLSNSEYSITDIAIACGFEEPSYYSKVFKKYVGMTPRQFR